MYDMLCLSSKCSNCPFSDKWVSCSLQIHNELSDVTWLHNMGFEASERTLDMPVENARDESFLQWLHLVVPDARCGACLASTCIHGGNEGELVWSISDYVAIRAPKPCCLMTVALLYFNISLQSTETLHTWSSAVWELFRMKSGGLISTIQFELTEM